MDSMVIVKRLGEGLGLIIGSCFSPTWILLPMVLEPYFDVHRASASLPNMTAEMIRYHEVIQSHPNEVLTQLLPLLLLTMVIGLGYISTLSWLGGQLLPLLFKQLASAQPNQS